MALSRKVTEDPHPRDWGEKYEQAIPTTVRAVLSRELRDCCATWSLLACGENHIPQGLTFEEKEIVTRPRLERESCGMNAGLHWVLNTLRLS